MKIVLSQEETKALNIIPDSHKVRFAHFEDGSCIISITQKDEDVSNKKESLLSKAKTLFSGLFTLT